MSLPVNGARTSTADNWSGLVPGTGINWDDTSSQRWIRSYRSVIGVPSGNARGCKESPDLSDSPMIPDGNVAEVSEFEQKVRLPDPVQDGVVPTGDETHRKCCGMACFGSLDGNWNRDLADLYIVGSVQICNTPYNPDGICYMPSMISTSCLHSRCPTNRERYTPETAVSFVKDTGSESHGMSSQ